MMKLKLENVKSKQIFFFFLHLGKPIQSYLTKLEEYSIEEG